MRGEALPSDSPGDEPALVLRAKMVPAVLLRRWRPARGCGSPFKFRRLHPSQWKAAQTTNAAERSNGGFRRRIKTQAVLPAPETMRKAALGVARVRVDPDAKDRWLGNPSPAARARRP
jgi:hypothetical protein